jgi:GMP synthase-like glutamine amidotransferase
MTRDASPLESVRLGILDAVPEEFYPASEKTDPEKFIDMFEGIGAGLSFSVYRPTAGHFPDSLAECDAYLITGSPCSVYDAYPWIRDMENFIHHAFSAGMPLVGICFGHQLIAQSLGGKVRLAEDGWLLGLHEIEVHGRKSWMEGRNARHPLYFINQDQVVHLPPGAELLASSASCPNAMYSIGDRLLSLQAHPEQPLPSMRAFTRILVEEYHIDTDLAERAHATMDSGEPDAELFARWIADFLRLAAEHAPLRE